jgi:hypothetical protein
MTLVTIDELTTYMGGLKLTENQRGITESVILPGVQQDLENYLNRPVEPILIREGLRPNDNGYVFFRTTPVHKIISIVTSSGQDTEYAAPTVPELSNPGEYRTYDEWGDPELYKYHVGVMPGGFSLGYYPSFGGYSMPYYRVEYVAGYNGYVNEALKLDITRVTAREVEAQFDDTLSLRGGGTEAAQDSDNRVKGWTQDELEKWDRLRKRVAVT